MPDPQAKETFVRSKLAWDELRLWPHATVVELYRVCLRERNEWLDDAAADKARWTVRALAGAVAIRYRFEDGRDRLVVCSPGGDARISLLDTPGLEAPAGRGWRTAFDSNDGTRDAARSSAVGLAPEAVDALVFNTPATVLLVAEAGGRDRSA